MIRLAVIDAAATRWQEATARLRGVVLQSCADDVPPLDAFDAAAFFEPASAKRERIERCLDAGKPVLLAANACPSLEALQALTEAAKPSSPLVVVNAERYLPSRQLVRQQLDAGKLGEPGLIRLHHWGSSDPSALACNLDLVTWFFGKRPDLVYAIETPADSDDRRGVQIHLGFPGGGMGLLSIARVPGNNHYCSLTVIGSAGAAYADDHPNMQLAMGSGAIHAVRSEEGVVQWSALIREFVENIRNEKACAYPTSWHNALAVGEAVRKSLESRQAVAV
jgi:predicted dehydrogenase